MNKKQFVAYILTFFAYAGLHSLRQGWSYSKTQLQLQPLKVDKVYLGLIDTIYLISYSMGMIVLGSLSSKMQLKYFVSFGMILASIFYMSVAFSYQITDSFNYVAVAILMSLNGFFQSTGWPGVMGIIGNWFQKGKMGILLGIWAINANAGNIIAQILCNVLDTQLNASWTYNFLGTGLLTIFIAILIILFLEDKPAQKSQIQKPLNQPQPTTPAQPLDESIITSEEQSPNIAQQPKQTKKQNFNIFQALRFPRVPSYVIGYAMLKGCSYGLLFWLPTYLSGQGLDSQKGYISAMVDTGSFIGGLAVGYAGDRYSYRAMFLSPFLFLSSLVMLLSAYLLTDVAWEYYISMFLVGITIGGPYNIIGTVITIDLAKQINNKNVSTARISALVEGGAAIFAAISQTIISIVPQSAIFYVFFAECIIAAAVLFPLFLSDYRQFRASLKSQNSHIILEQQK